MKKGYAVFAMLVAVTFVAAELEARGRGRRGDRERRASERAERGIPCIFEGFDADGDGALSKEERRAARQAVRENVLAMFDADGDGELSEEERAAARAEKIAAHDTDGDGELSAEEREAARAARCQEEEEAMVEELIRGRKGRARCRFAEFDADGDGTLSDEEKAAARAAVREGLLADHDADGDGELSEEERAAARAARRAAVLEAHDADGDGSLSRDERAAARASRCGSEEETLVAELIAEPTFLRGDTNGDGGVDLADSVAGLSFLFAGAQAPVCPDAMDANDDGVLNMSDPLMALSMLFSGGDPLPHPSEEAGTDPTPDSLGCGVIVSSL